MEYNTARNHLIIPEYGRHIQHFIEDTCKIESREERNKRAQYIVNVMGALLPHLRDITDFKHKLWDHLFIISGFKLDVDSPYPVPTANALRVKPKKPSYPTYKIRWAHYGKNIEKVIGEIIQMEEGAARQKLTVDLANFMKILYVTWNKENVEDQLIIDQLKELSNGKLHLSDNFRLQEIKDVQAAASSITKTSKRTIKEKAPKREMQNGGRRYPSKKKR